MSLPSVWTLQYCPDSCTRVCFPASTSSGRFFHTYTYRTSSIVLLRVGVGATPQFMVGRESSAFMTSGPAILPVSGFGRWRGDETPTHVPPVRAVTWQMNKGDSSPMLTTLDWLTLTSSSRTVSTVMAPRGAGVQAPLSWVLHLAKGKSSSLVHHREGEVKYFDNISILFIQTSGLKVNLLTQ